VEFVGETMSDKALGPRGAQSYLPNRLAIALVNIGYRKIIVSGKKVTTTEYQLILHAEVLV